MATSPIHQSWIQRTNTEFVDPALGQGFRRSEVSCKSTSASSGLLTLNAKADSERTSAEPDDFPWLTLLLSGRRPDAVFAHHRHRHLNSQPNFLQLGLLGLPRLMECCQLSSPSCQIYLADMAISKPIFDTM